MSHCLITHYATEAYVGILNPVTRSRWFQALADLPPTLIEWKVGWVSTPIWTLWRRVKGSKHSLNFGGYVSGNRFPPSRP